MKKVAIIGGGAAGMIAAITAASAGVSVDLFEKNSRIGKKILASGNGRCNISNTALSVDDYFGNNPDFVAYALRAFDFNHFKKFCKSIGLLLNTKSEGKTYPLSDEAKSVVTALESYALSKGVGLHCDANVTAVERNGNHFTVTTDNHSYEGYEALLITTGSEAAPQLGSSGDGYRFAEAFGHATAPAYPSLVALELDSTLPSKMAGVKQLAEVTLYIDGSAEEKRNGDILFTKYGISGFAILDISQHASFALQHYRRVEIGLKLLPDFDRQSLSSQLQQLLKSLPDYSIETILSGLIPSKIARTLLQQHNIAPDTGAAQISTKVVKQLSNTLSDWRFHVSDTHGFKHAEVSGGGVLTDEVDPHTMMSKKCEGLYFAGEVLDIVGRRGGYNLHFAWASGYLAGKSLSS